MRIESLHRNSNVVKKVMTSTDKTSTNPEHLTDEDLTEAQGGISLLLPAVQKVREAAARSTTDTTTTSLQQKISD